MGYRTIAMMAQRLPRSPNGSIVVVQRMLLVDQRRHNDYTREAEAWLKLIHNVYNSNGATNDRPLCILSATLAMHLLLPASFERPVSDRPPRRPLCDCFEHAQNFTATIASIAKSERPLCHH